MLMSLILGGILLAFTFAIQIVLVVVMIRYLQKVMLRNHHITKTWWFDASVIGTALLILTIGHIAQVSAWAFLFLQLNEFDDFLTAFYHSAVNFSSLGYGDIVMSESWRLLGALEAGNGVLMFGLSSGTIIAVMMRIFSQHTDI